MRGEKVVEKIPDDYQTGSSPHARGKVPHIHHRYFAVRIIPACAGKSFLCQRCFSATKDHPRMRGEKNKSMHITSGQLGSSPHARGKDLNMQLNKSMHRIIPACAGKRLVSFSIIRFCQDHPRMRGEKLNCS